MKKTRKTKAEKHKIHRNKFDILLRHCIYMISIFGTELGTRNERQRKRKKE